MDNRLYLMIKPKEGTQMKKWQKPELTILVKAQPEENVLLHCKANKAPMGTGGEQSATLGHGCQATKDASCQACRSLGGALS